MGIVLESVDEKVELWQSAYGTYSKLHQELLVAIAEPFIKATREKTKADYLKCKDELISGNAKLKDMVTDYYDKKIKDLDTVENITKWSQMWLQELIAATNTSDSDVGADGETSATADRKTITEFDVKINHNISKGIIAFFTNEAHHNSRLDKNILWKYTDCENILAFMAKYEQECKQVFTRVRGEEWYFTFQRGLEYCVETEMSVYES